MTLLHDSYRLESTIPTLYKHDKNRFSTRSKSGPATLQSFLSCTASNNEYLGSENAQKIIIAAFQNVDFTRNPEKCYRVVSTAFRSFCDEKPQISTSFDTSLTRQPNYIIGVDPGITGAIAVIEIGVKPAFIGVFDMPLYTLKVSGKDRKRIDLTGLSFLLESYSHKTKIAVIEDVGQVGTNADPFSSFVFGFATGAVHGALAMAGVKIEKVKPQVWKAALGLDSDKTLSLKLALKIFPESEKYLKRKMDHGRAEAILLAWFAFKNLRKA
jgi:hypothetical protein